MYNGKIKEKIGVWNNCKWSDFNFKCKSMFRPEFNSNNKSRNKRGWLIIDWELDQDLI